jgi:hypothetical protein
MSWRPPLRVVYLDKDARLVRDEAAALKLLRAWEPVNVTVWWAGTPYTARIAEDPNGILVRRLRVTSGSYGAMESGWSVEAWSMALAAAARLLRETEGQR